MSQIRTVVLTDKYIRANASTKGGYTRAQVKEWGGKMATRKGVEESNNWEDCQVTKTDNRLAPRPYSVLKIWN